MTSVLMSVSTIGMRKETEGELNFRERNLGVASIVVVLKATGGYSLTKGGGVDRYKWF